MQKPRELGRCSAGTLSTNDMTRRSTQGDSGGRSGGSRPPKRRRSSVDLDADRRSFLFIAVAIASGGILGCDPSGTRDRRLPGSAGMLDPIPPNVEVDQRIEPPPVKRIVQRPLPPTSEPRVRVRVATVRPPDRVVRIDGDGRTVGVRSADDPRQPKTVQLPATIESTLEGWVVIEAAGTPRAATFAFPPRPLEVMPQQGSKGVRTTATGATPWPWGLRIVARTDEALGAVDLVVHVAMEEYLPGVLAKELYNTWSLETHLAQAVAAGLLLLRCGVGGRWIALLTRCGLGTGPGRTPRRPEEVLHVEHPRRLVGALDEPAEPGEVPGLAVRHRRVGDAGDQLAGGRGGWFGSGRVAGWAPGGVRHTGAAGGVAAAGAHLARSRRRSRTPAPAPCPDALRGGLAPGRRG
jgi:hypothetical protein